MRSNEQCSASMLHVIIKIPASLNLTGVACCMVEVAIVMAAMTDMEDAQVQVQRAHSHMESFLKIELKFSPIHVQKLIVPTLRQDKAK